MAEITRDDIDALVGPATPHFAYQLRARVKGLIADLPEDDPVRKYGEEQMDLLDRLGYASSKAEEGPREPRSKPGWERDPELGAGGRAAPAQMTFEGASVFVTGGSRGIGREIALRFADEGAKRVAIGYMRKDARGRSGRGRAARRAARSRRSCAATSRRTRVAEEVAALGPLDALVHNAATGVARPALETEDKHWDWTLAANARALLSLARAAVPCDAERRRDRRDLQPRLVARARELRARRHVEGGARVGRALPRRGARAARHPRQRGVGRRRQDGRARRLPEQGGDDSRGRSERTPAGRMVEARDIADAVLFLCGPHSEMIRGQTIIVDGGFSLPA